MATNFLQSAVSPTAATGVGGININPTGSSLLSSLTGGSGALGQAANQIWQNGQFMPYNLQLPGANLNFNGNSATGGLSQPMQGIQNSQIGQIGNILGSGGVGDFSSGGFLPGQYNQIFNGQNFNNNVQSNFQNMTNGIMPFLQQINQSNLDSEQAKGTLASTAGAYQTAGSQMGLAGTLANNYNQAFQNTLGQANSQFNAAANTANTGINEQNGLFSNILGQNNQIAQLMQTGGNLGQQQSTANTNASMPFLQAGQTASQGQSGLLNSLLFGNGSGTGGLLGSLLGGLGGSSSGGLLGGSSSGGGGLLGNIGGALGSLFNSGTGVNSSNTNGSLTLGNMSNPYTDPFSNTSGLANQYSNDAGNSMITSGSDLGNINWGDTTGTSTLDTGQSLNTTDLSGLGGSFSSAGGQAANQNFLSSSATNPELAGLSTDQGTALTNASSSAPNFNMPSTTGSLSNGLGAGMGALNLAQGLNKGGVGGYLQAAGGANKLLNSAGVNTGSTGSAIGAAGNALGIYNGIQRGGVAGYGSAAVNAGQLAENAGLISGSSTVGQAIPVVGAALSVYNFANNWQSGNTGSDAMNGAEAGAAVGSVVPGIGTAIGAVIGGAVGALTSAFGPGETDPETAGVQNVINATSANGNNPAVAASVQNPYLSLTGLFDDKSSTLPIYQQYGRMGEQSFTNALVGKINTAVEQNPSLKDNPSAVYSQVVQPWVNSMGDWSKVGSTYQATVQGTLQGMTNEYMNGTASVDWKAIGGENPFGTLYENSPFQGINATPINTGGITGDTGARGR
jgi:hypothetical protein